MVMPSTIDIRETLNELLVHCVCVCIGTMMMSFECDSNENEPKRTHAEMKLSHWPAHRSAYPNAWIFIWQIQITRDRLVTMAAHLSLSSKWNRETDNSFSSCLPIKRQMRKGKTMKAAKKQKTKMLQFGSCPNALNAIWKLMRWSLVYHSMSPEQRAHTSIS